MLPCDDSNGKMVFTREIEGTRRVFSIGDTVRVRLDRVDPVEHKLQFSLLEPAAKRRR